MTEAWPLRSPAVWITDDAHATILYASTTVRRLFDHTLCAEPPARLIEYVHPEDRHEVRAAMAELPDGRYETSYRIRVDEDDYRTVRDRALPMIDAEGDVARICRIVHEVEDGTSLAPLETLLLDFPDLAFVIDRDGRYLEYLAGPTAEPLLYDDPELMIGATLAEVLPTAVADAILDTIRQTLERGEPTSIVYDLDVPAGRRWFEARIAPTLGAADTVVFVARDVTDRIERERQLSFQRSVLDAQQAALPYGVLVLDADGSVVSANDRLRELWVIPTTLGDEDLVATIDDRSPMPTSIRSSIDDRCPRDDEFVLDDGRVIEWHHAPVTCSDGKGIGHLWTFRDATPDRRREETLRRQRDELARLEQLNGTIRAIGRSIVQAETRAEIEADVCDSFAAAAGFHAGIFVEYDPDDGAVEVREASHAIGVESSSPHMPLARAARTGAVQAVPDAHETTNGIAVPDEWRSYVVVPVFHHGFVYGMLIVFPTFDIDSGNDLEEVLAELGEMVGHAINAAERSRLLDADECLEVTYQSAVFGEPLVDAAGAGAQAVIDRVVPVGADAHALYVRVSDVDPTAIAPAIGEIDTVTAVRTLATADDQATFEVRVEGETIPGVVAAAGGFIREMRLVGEDLRFTVLLPSERRVRELTDHLQSVDSTCRLTAIRTVSAPDRGPKELRTALEEALPERQRTALELGFFGGYFDWPRRSTGEELAEQLGVSPSTFHYHLRQAQHRLLEFAFGS